MHISPGTFRFPDRLATWLSDSLWQTAEPTLRQLAREQESLKQLWPMLAEDRGQREYTSSGRPTKHYSLSSEAVRAYAAYYLPANLLKVPAIFAEASALGAPIIGEPLHCLDIGCGPGTTAFGLAWWAQKRGGVARVISLDASREFLQQGKSLARSWREAFPDSSVEFEWERVDVESSFDETLRAVREHKPNFVSFANSIAEICADPEARGMAVDRLVNELGQLSQADGRRRWLLIVEPGSRASSRELLQLRDKLRVRDTNNIYLPCLDSRPCGALQDPDDWCHEEIACTFPVWLNQLGRAARLEKRSLLFSYLLVGVSPDSREKPKNWPLRRLRMVSQRLERKGFDECWFCSPEGKLRSRLTHSKNKKRSFPLALPKRGDLVAELSRDDKDEVELLQFHFPDGNPKGDFTDLFASD